jgi:hypothetical protein
VFLLQADHHAAEVLPHEVFEQLFTRVVDILDVVLFEELVGEVGTGFEGEALGEDERVVAVEEDVFDLVCALVGCRLGSVRES